MKSLYLERITYGFNLVFVAISIIIPFGRMGNMGDKVALIYMLWLLVGCYFSILTLVFYKSNIKRIKKSNTAFKWISLVPFIYLIPFVEGQIIVSRVLVKTLDFSLVLGSSIFILITIINIFIKNKHATTTASNI